MKPANSNGLYGDACTTIHLLLSETSLLQHYQRNMPSRLLTLMPFHGTARVWDTADGISCYFRSSSFSDDISTVSTIWRVPGHSPRSSVHLLESRTTRDTVVHVISVSVPHQLSRADDKRINSTRVRVSAFGSHGQQQGRTGGTRGGGGKREEELSQYVCAFPLLRRCAAR